MTTLSQLSQLISTSVEALQKNTAAEGIATPSLDDSWNFDSEKFRSNPQNGELATTIAAAAYQLAAALMPPDQVLYQVAGGHLKSAALRVALEGHVVELLKPHPKGLHISEVAKKTGLDGGKLGRCLRMLATSYVFKEVAPDVFANNRVSAFLDTGKKFEDIMADPDSKYDDTAGYGAFLGVVTGEANRGSVCMWESLSDPVSGPSGEAHLSPIARGLGINVPFYAWYAEPEQAVKRKNFGIAMEGMAANQPSEALIDVFDWNKLPTDAVLVDVGGGVGVSSLAVGAKFPIKVVVQDRPEVVEQGIQRAKKLIPADLESGRIVFQGHDFFTPQPVKKADVYLIKQCLHNCSDKYAAAVLRNLRDAAGPNTHLVIVETIIRHACRDDNKGFAFTGAEEENEAPAPLLANYGQARDTRYIMDISMWTLLNAQDRTLRHWNELLTETGWKIVRVHRGLPYYEPIIAVPA